MALTEEQKIALALTPKFTAGLSVLCSSIIVWLILTDPHRRNKVYHRLLLGICLTDIFTSFWWVMSTWPIPEGEALWSVGTTQTCTCQGFFLQVGIANPLYNLSLSVYYLLAVHCQWGEVQLRKYECLFHLGPLGWGLTSALIGLPLKIFNNASLWCWIANHEGRNMNTAPYRWGFFYAPLWFAVVMVSINMARLVSYFSRLTLATEKHVKPGISHDENTESECCVEISSSTKETNQTNEDEAETETRQAHKDTNPAIHPSEINTVGAESQASAGSQSNATSRFAERRRRLAWQCLRYTLVFYCTWFPITLLRIFQAVGKPVQFPLLYAAAFLTPLQGLPNFVVYLYPIFVERLQSSGVVCCGYRYRCWIERRPIQKSLLRLRPTPGMSDPAEHGTAEHRSLTLSTPFHVALAPIREDDRDDENDDEPNPSWGRRFIRWVEAAPLHRVSSLFKSQSDFHSEGFYHGDEVEDLPVPPPLSYMNGRGRANSNPSVIPPVVMAFGRASGGSLSTDDDDVPTQEHTAPSALRDLLASLENEAATGQVRLWNSLPPWNKTASNRCNDQRNTTQQSGDTHDSTKTKTPWVEDHRVSDSQSEGSSIANGHIGLQLTGKVCSIHFSDAAPVLPNRLQSQAIDASEPSESEDGDLSKSFAGEDRAIGVGANQLSDSPPIPPHRLISEIMDPSEGSQMEEKRDMGKIPLPFPNPQTKLSDDGWMLNEYSV